MIIDVSIYTKLMCISVRVFVVLSARVCLHISCVTNCTNAY